MMNCSLFRSMLKMHGKTMLTYGLGMAAYMLLVIGVYPSIAHSAALNTVLKSLPQGMMRLFGSPSGYSQVGNYLAGEFYVLLYVIILAIYTVSVSTKLMAHLIDNGSMAYLLATPISRTKIAVTQAIQLIVGIIVIGFCATASALLGVQWFVRGHGLDGLDVSHFIEMNIVGVLLFLVIGSYSYLFSCMARDERTALSLSASLTVVFYALNTMGTLSDQVGWMKYLSVFAAFNAQTLINGQDNFAALSVSLAVAALVLFGLAVVGFRRRQLSL